MKNLSCYSASICDILRHQQVSINEEQLFFSQYLLDIECKDIYDSIYSDIEVIVNDVLNKNNIILETLVVGNIAELNMALDTYYFLLVKTNIHYLKYSDFFCNAKTNQTNHYIILLKDREGAIQVEDSYIPTTPQTRYKGSFSVDKDFVLESKFFVVKALDNVIAKVEMCDMMRLIIQEYFDGNHNAEAFNQFIKNIKSINEDNKSILYEMAVAISTSGLLATRKVFARIISHFYFINENTIVLANDLHKKYNLLRLLLLKCSIKVEERTLEDIRALIYDLKSDEENLLKSIGGIENAK